MAYLASPSRGSSSFHFNRPASTYVEDLGTQQFSNPNFQAIEEDLALIRQGEQQMQQQQPSDEGISLFPSFL